MNRPDKLSWSVCCRLGFSEALDGDLRRFENRVARARPLIAQFNARVPGSRTHLKQEEPLAQTVGSTRICMSSYTGTSRPLARMHKAQCQQPKPTQNVWLAAAAAVTETSFTKRQVTTGPREAKHHLAMTGYLVTVDKLLNIHLGCINAFQ